VFPKLVQAVTQIKATIMSYYPQYWHITPGGNSTPNLGTPALTLALYCAMANHSCIIRTLVVWNMTPTQNKS